MEVMKRTALPLFFLLLLSAAFASFAFFAAASEEQEPVRDIAGKILRTETKYYVVPAASDINGGGLVLANSSYLACPLGVFQRLHKFQQGFPLIFTPFNPKKRVIRVTTDLNIKFAASSKCPQSTVWKVDAYDELSGRFFIGVGGIEGQPGPNTIYNWFKIEKLGFKDYKLVYCPWVCAHCRVMCKDVGIFVQNGNHRLALSDAPFRVVFKKA